MLLGTAVRFAALLQNLSASFQLPCTLPQTPGVISFPIVLLLPLPLARLESAAGTAQIRTGTQALWQHGSYKQEMGVLETRQQRGVGIAPGMETPGPASTYASYKRLACSLAFIDDLIQEEYRRDKAIKSYCCAATCLPLSGWQAVLAQLL